MTFTVLAVCTGNICRSPALEALLRHSLDGSVVVASAGTHAVVGSPVSPPMDDLLTASGVDASDFVARQLTAGIIREADLVLALTTAHRAWIVDREPAAVRRTLTLRELARLTSTVAPGTVVGASAAARLAALVPAALLERPRHAGRAHDDDVVDPYGRSERTYRESYDQILGALAPIVSAVRPGPGSAARTSAS
ncbi:low molecular weight phosphatase family protein [Antribacter gilvus]|uniref:arsenate reductase/protein-tyrosine-phosphatase family protein n=1 Tax=Antribacter gilvus TaxID=2304675 RepID=UPI000F791F76|nr:low molecular weight phosphatase family protein [Antribacter gilvus]